MFLNTEIRYQRGGEQGRLQMVHQLPLPVSNNPLLSVPSPMPPCLWEAGYRASPVTGRIWGYEAKPILAMVHSRISGDKRHTEFIWVESRVLVPRDHMGNRTCECHSMSLVEETSREGGPARQPGHMRLARLEEEESGKPIPISAM